jgi:hypothetical protein
MLDKFFNKPDPESKVRKENDEDIKVGVSSLRIIAKNTLVFKSVAKELKAINGAFGNYLKLNGIKPAVGEPISATTKSLADSKEFKMAKVKVQVSRQGEKRQTFVTRIVDKLLDILKLILLGAALSAIIITEKIVDMVSSAVSTIFDAVVSGATAIINGIKNFFDSVDWLDLLTTSFNKYLSFISFGFISEDQTNKIMGDAGSAYRSILTGIGGFLKGVVDWIKPKLEAVGRFIGKDILGVDVDKVIEKRNERKRLVEESKKLEEESINLDKVTKELVTKRDKLKQEKEKKEKELEEKRNAELKKKAEEADKKRSVFDRVFNRVPKEEKKEEVKPTPPPIEERGKPAVAAPVTPAPAPKAAPAAPAAPPPPKAPAPAPAVKPEPKLDVSKVPPSVKPVPSDVKEDKKTETPKGGLSTLTKTADSGVDISQFKPEFEKRLVAMAAAFKEQTGKLLIINSGYRSNEKQKQLYDADLAENNGKPSGLVAQPMPPLGAGIGSVHIKGLGVDIKPTQGKKGAGPSKGFLNELAGTRTAPTGWLEKFGLIRNVKGEDWHITISGAPPTPDDAAVTGSSGATVDPSTGQQTGQGLNVGKSSTELAAEQRKQSKPNNPLYVNATTTNNTAVEKNTTLLQRKAA